MFELRVDGHLIATHADESLLLAEKAKYHVGWDDKRPCLSCRSLETSKGCQECGGSGVVPGPKLGPGKASEETLAMLERVKKGEVPMKALALHVNEQAIGLAYAPERVTVSPKKVIEVRRNGALIETTSGRDEAEAFVEARMFEHLNDQAMLARFGRVVATYVTLECPCGAKAETLNAVAFHQEHDKHGKYRVLGHRCETPEQMIDRIVRREYSVHVPAALLEPDPLLPEEHEEPVEVLVDE